MNLPQDAQVSHTYRGDTRDEGQGTERSEAVEITEVRIKLMEEPGDRLRAFCSITFDDCFVVRDLKIIEGGSGPFVAMPSRKLTAHCPQCRTKNHLRAAHCNQCGKRLNGDLAVKDEEGRSKLYADIAHPINSACREMLQQKVIEEFEAELERAEQPGYTPRYDDFYADEEPRDIGARCDRRNETDGLQTSGNGFEDRAA